MTTTNKIFHVTSFNEKNVELTSSEELNILYATIMAEENFVLEWKEEGYTKSRLVIGKEWSSKIATGDIELTSCQKTEDKIK